MKSILLRLLCHFDGGHRFFLDDLKRVDDMHVMGFCHRCARAHVATCGLDLPGRLCGYRKDWPYDARKHQGYYLVDSERHPMRRYLYHYHASIQTDPSSVTEFDGMLKLVNRIENLSDVARLKDLVSEGRYDVSEMSLTSLSYLGRERWLPAIRRAFS